MAYSGLGGRMPFFFASSMAAWLRGVGKRGLNPWVAMNFLMVSTLVPENSSASPSSLSSNGAFHRSFSDADTGGPTHQVNFWCAFLYLLVPSSLTFWYISPRR